MRVLRAVIRVVAAVLVALVLVVALAEGWARLNLDTSSVARAIAWKDADVDDYTRFPSRPIRAGSHPWVLGRRTEAPSALEEVWTPNGPVNRRALLETTGTAAFIVLQGDEIVVEEYYNGSSREAIQTSFSVAKSFMSSLFGIAVDQGLIDSLAEPITSYLPELAERDERFQRIAIRHLLTMTSGLRYEEEGLPWSDDSTTYYAPDLRAAALSVEIEGEPGRAFHYNNYNLLLGGMILERATGEHIATYMQRVLWQRLGAEADASWSLDSEASGFEKSESGINARAIDFARFGLLHLREGRNAAGDRVVPSRWIESATAEDTSTDPAARYQYWWWVDTSRPGRYYAAGNKGQYIYVAPDKDVVVVRMGRDFGSVGDRWPAVLRDVADRMPSAGT
jgi:CubicO group peptidase (beta-lactamase class C family)